MSEETKRKAIQLAGDGTNRDGDTMAISVDGYNVILVNKGGTWVVSSWQRAENARQMVRNALPALGEVKNRYERNGDSAGWSGYTSGIKQQYGI